MAEKKDTVENKSNSIPESLQNLTKVKNLILDTFFKEDPSAQEWATKALFSPAYIDPDTKSEYYAPKSEALPYLFQLFRQDHPEVDLGDLYVTPVDGKNTRDIDLLAETTKAGDYAIALNIGSLFKFDINNKLISFDVRAGGDEFLAFGIDKEVDSNAIATDQVHAKYPKTQSISDCGLHKDAANQLKNFILPQDTHRPFDIVNLLYHLGKEKLPTDNFNKVETAKQIRVTLDNSLDNSITVKKFKSEHAMSEYPLEARSTIKKNQNNATLRHLIDLAVFNPMFDREANVYTPDAFLTIIQEKISANPKKKYLLIQFSPVQLKRINKLLTRLNGNIAIVAADRLISSKDNFDNIPRSQRAGSEIAFIEDTEENKAKLININKSVTDESILYAENDPDHPGVVATITGNLDSSTNLAQFWDNIVDPGKIIHYANELDVVKDNCSPKALLSFVSGRYNNRLDMIRELVDNDFNLFTKLSGKDLDVLESNLKDIGIEEVVGYINQLLGIFAKLFGRQQDSSIAPVPSSSLLPQETPYNTTPSVS